LGAGVSLLLSFFSCATGSKPSAGTVAPAAFGSPEEAEATLLMREDERSFDAAVLRAGAESPDARLRRAAAHALGEIGGLQALRPLEALTKDPDERVRAEAALGIEILGASVETPVLIPLLADPSPSVVCAAARALGALGRDDGGSALVASLGVLEGNARACLLYALAHFHEEEDAAAARQFASDPDPEIRRAAIYAFSRAPIDSSREALLSALSDADPEAAAFAARGLGVLGDPTAVPSLARALDRREIGVLVQSLIAIEQLEEKRAMPLPPDRVARIVALAGSASPGVAESAIACLREFTDDRAATRVINAQAASGQGRRREVALFSAIAAYRERGRSFLEAAAASPDENLRAAAAESLAFLSDNFAASFRDRFLLDPSPKVRESAVSSTPADSAHRAMLTALLSEEDPGVRSAVIDRLAAIGDSAVLPDIARALEASRNDPIPDAAISAVAAAQRYRDDAARAVLTSALSDPRPVVQRMARRSLIQLFGVDPRSIPEATYATRRTLADYQRILQEARKNWIATFRTARGAFTVRLDGREAPMTVDNFRELAGRKFFDNMTFHRVVPDFVTQSGDPTGTGHGGPGYEIRDEINSLTYSRGVLGMALEGVDTGGSQFFVTLSPQPHLDGRFTAFGRVQEGAAVLDLLDQEDRLESVVVEAAP
jgi:cyclophilin family peptidyl-prolyl cis-trans isomerase/HEAT repeat protein